jgi:hypothetical protein
MGELGAARNFLEVRSQKSKREYWIRDIANS